MIGKLWKNWKDWRDENQLAAYEARDAEFGTPTKATLTDRAVNAARKGWWKTAIAAIDAGGDVNAPVDQRYRSDHSAIEYKQSLAILAAEQRNADALGRLLERGADQSFSGSYTISGSNWARGDHYTVLEFAVREGAKDCVELLLRKGGNPQASLDGALKIAAREKSYLDMASALLDAGAKDFEGAQREAEVYRNDKAIPLIKGAAKKAFEAAQERTGTPVNAPVAPVQSPRP